MPLMGPNPSHTGQTTLVSKTLSSRQLALDGWDHTMSILGLPTTRTPPHVICILVDETPSDFRMRHTSCTHWCTLSLVTMHLWNRWWRTLSHYISQQGQCCCTRLLLSVCPTPRGGGVGGSGRISGWVGVQPPPPGWGGTLWGPLGLSSQYHFFLSSVAGSM